MAELHKLVRGIFAADIWPLLKNIARAAEQIPAP